MQNENTKKSDLIEGNFYAWDMWKRRDDNYSTYSPFTKVKLISKTAKSFYNKYENAPTKVVIEYEAFREVKNPNADWSKWIHAGRDINSEFAPYLYDANGTPIREPYLKTQSVNVWELLKGNFEEVEAERIELKRIYEERDKIREQKREEKETLSKQMISDYKEVREFFGLNVWSNGLSVYDNDTFDKERRILEVLRKAMESEKGNV